MTHLMNEQEVFEKVVTHLFTQGYPAAKASSGRCMYRDPTTGRKCGIGAIIPDDKYKKAFEDKGVSYIKQYCPDALPVTDNISTRFLDDLQRLHDDWINNQISQTRSLKEILPFTKEGLYDKAINFAKFWYLNTEFVGPLMNSPNTKAV